MSTKSVSADGQSVSCCPNVSDDRAACNRLEFHYRLNQIVPVATGGRTQQVTVEVIVNALLEVCRGPLRLGNLAHTTTLFPGEKVRLFTQDRRSRFSFDSESKLSYRHQQAYEEQFFMQQMSDFMSDVSLSDRGGTKSSSQGSASASGSTSGPLETLISGPSVSAKGSYSASSSFDFMRELHQHAQASARSSEQMTHSVSAIQVGEVSQRTHVQGESEDHFEAASRDFSNQNKFHAVTYFFYQLNQETTVKFTIQSVKRRVIDPAGETRLLKNPALATTEVTVIPDAVLATSDRRLKVQQAAVASNQVDNRAQLANFASETANFSKLRLAEAVPLSDATRAAALKKVDDGLVKAGILNEKTRELKDETKAELSFTQVIQLPTPGLLVKGCLDECEVAEPEYKQLVQLDLDRKKLENELLKKQIDLLDKSQEYRCCPCDCEPATAEA